MQIMYEQDALKRIEVDTAKVEQFLREQGVTQKKINRLRIHVHHAPSAQQRSDLIAQGDGENAWGLYSGPRDVYLFTNKRPQPMALSLNRTLFHELRHFMRNGYRRGETKLPHAHRPSEIDAYTFAAEHAPLQTLVSILGELSSGEDTLILAIDVLVCGVFGVTVFLRGIDHLLTCFEKGVRARMLPGGENMQEQRPGSDTPPTLEDIEKLAQELHVTFTNTKGDEWFDLMREEAPVLEGMYRTNQYGIDAAYSALIRLRTTLQAVESHQHDTNEM